MRLLEFVGTIEILVLVAIGIEVFALYKHTKLENRMEEHIQNTCDRLLKTEELIKVFDEHVNKFDEHLVRLDERMKKVNEYMMTLNEHLIRYDEHINRLDDRIMQSYFLGTEKKDAN